MAEQLLAGLPGGDLVAKGLSDLASGSTTTVEALLVAMAATRLRACGLEICGLPAYERDPELLLYETLRVTSSNAYRDYNALVRRLVSCERALEHRNRGAGGQRSSSERSTP